MLTLRHTRSCLTKRRNTSKQSISQVVLGHYTKGTIKIGHSESAWYVFELYGALCAGPVLHILLSSDTTGRRRQKPPLEMSENFQNPTSNQHVTLDDAHTEERDTQQPKIWAGRSVLKVYFMNPKILEEWANGTRIANIMTWASSSPLYDQIPRFEETNNDLTVDIRVMFSGVHAFLAVSVIVLSFQDLI